MRVFLTSKNGHNLPDIENLMLIAELTNKPYSFFLDTNVDDKTESSLVVRDRIFQEENMFTRLRSTAASEGLQETVKYMILQ